MIRNVYLNGKIGTLLVMEDEHAPEIQNPLFEVLKQQAERIELLENQNNSLIRQEELLIKLLELNTSLDELVIQVSPNEKPIEADPSVES